MRWLTAELLAMCVAAGCTNEDQQARYPQQPQAQTEEGAAPGDMYQNAPQVPEQQPYSQQPYSQQPQPAQPQPQAQPPAQYRRGHLGIAIQPMTGELRTFFGAPPDRGVLVAHVAPGSTAEQAGVRVGDVLVFVGGRLIQNVDDVRSALAERTDNTLRLDVVRRGQPMQLQATFGARPDQQAQPML